MKMFLQLCMFLIFFGLSTSDEGSENDRKDSRAVTLGQDCSTQWQIANNPCTNNPLNKRNFPHPSDNRKFIQCGALNRMFIIQCPPGEAYSQASSACISQSAIVTQPIVNIGTIGITNPCTAQNIQAGRIFFGLLADNTKFIECSQNGNAQLLTCPSQMVWDQNRHSCIFPVQHGVVYQSGTTGILAGGLIRNPCRTPAGSTNNLFFSHPDPTKFIQCDLQGDAYVQQCPPALVWNQYLETCSSQVAAQGGAIGKHCTRTSQSSRDGCSG